MMMKKQLLLGFAVVCCAAVAYLAVRWNSSAATVPDQQQPAASQQEQAEVRPARVAVERVEEAPAKVEIARQPVDPATIGVEHASRPNVAEEPLVRAVGLSEAMLPDPRLKKVLQVVEKGVAQGKKTGNTHWMPESLFKLMTERRYWYLGPAEGCPPYKNTHEIKYVSTSMDGLKVVFMLSRQEFPRAFEKAN